MPKQTETSSSFIKFIAYLQVIGIVLVVLGHSFHMYPDGNNGHSMLLYRMLFSFRMPLFMFVSGFLMIYTTYLRPENRRPSVGKFVRTKILRLLLPFAVLSMVTFYPRTLMSSVADDAMELSWQSFLLSLTHTRHLVIPYYWFLQASFLLLCLNFIIISVSKKYFDDRITYTFLLLTFTLLPFLPIEYTDYFSVREAVRLGMYFAAGMFYSRFKSYIDTKIDWTSPLFLCGASLIWAVAFFLTEHTPWVFICSCAGIAMCVSVTRMLEKNNITVLDHLIGANYMIFLLSWYCNVFFQQILHHFMDIPWWIHSSLSLISGIYIPWLAYRYLQSHPHSRWVRITSYLLGQSIKKNV